MSVLWKYGDKNSFLKKDNLNPHREEMGKVEEKVAKRKRWPKK
jgi:hypothetical protein